MIHDGVVDYDQARGECDAEEGQGVDAEAEDLNEGKGADERDGNGDRWNDRGPPVLQKEEDDDDYDYDGFADRANDLIDRLADNKRCVDGNDALKPGWVRLFELGEDCSTPFVDVEGVGVRKLQDTDADGIATFEGAAGELQAGVVGFSTNFGTANVLDQNDSAAIQSVS